MRRVLVDDAIAAQWAFESLGERGRSGVLEVEVVARRGADIDRKAVLDSGAEFLVTRSVTRVDAALVAGTRLRFVGSATAGVDHVDLDALRSRDIAFAHAPGCNAPDVVAWVVEAMRVASLDDPGWHEGPVGIIGVGEVGGRLARHLRASGREVLVCDPPRASREPGVANFRSFDEVVARSNVLSLHVPLIGDGPHPTHHLVDRPLGCRLINTSRGSVVKRDALRSWTPGRAIVDVWEGEPDIDWTVVQAPPFDGPVRLASPHVAGYAQAAKLRATEMIHDALRTFLVARGGIPPDHPRWSCQRLLAETEVVPFDHVGDDQRLRALCRLPPSDRGSAFEALRRGYALRHVDRPNRMEHEPAK